MKSSDFFEMIALRENLPVSTVKKVFSSAKKCAKECAMKGETVKVGGFFSIKLAQRQSRLCTNPQTGRKFFSQPKKVIVLKTSKTFSKID